MPTQHHRATRHLSKADRILAKFIREIGPATLKSRAAHTPFEALLESIVYQQLTGKAAATILGRVLALYPGKKHPEPADILATPDPHFRGAGLSGAKTAAIKDLALKAQGGLVPSRAEIRKLSDAEIVARLTEIRGIGRWTVEMLLIFNLGRADVIPSTDYGVRKGFQVAYGWRELPTPKELEAHAEVWKPFRSIAAWYLWRVLDLPIAQAHRRLKLKAKKKSAGGRAASPARRARASRPAATKPKGARSSRRPASRKPRSRAPV